MKRGDIYFANLNPTTGSEIQKKRPVLIISNNANNRFSDTVTILPLSSNIKKIYPFEVLLKMTNTGLKKDSKVQCHQIRTISKQRIKNSKRAGNVSHNIINKIEDAIKIHMDLH